ncbi:HAMP domain-containing sensor histidine kinase [Paenibacillus filicis]|uniref:histidine kinase n=1 Tax=Paenibacillus gyeongsangnamensis TaxID=3388067 RepID=A0ABT4QEJ5_9BACL|nr:HAMP domain-containing sensor histidine kinase [Paenibacillus filicis]MCZ8515299.1 HAMP domain-containing sensor histidine kinase [Paenibacillus filicis]
MLLRLHDEVIRLSQLVDDLHVLSLAEAGRLLLLDRKPLDLTLHLERIVDDVKYEAEENGLDIRLFTISRPVTVMADARRIMQVFFNLLTNAIRYTPRGGKITVEIEDRVIDQNAYFSCVSVIDTGIRILPGDKKAFVTKKQSQSTGGDADALRLFDAS